MTRATRPYHSPARDARTERTRDAIAAAFVAQLGREGRADLSAAEAAQAAGVSVRTVYHHFPDREARLTAAAEWVDRQLHPDEFVPRSPGDLTDLARRAYAASEAHDALVRAQYATAGLAGEVRTHRRARRIAQIETVLEGIGAPARPTRRAVVLVAHLVSAEAGIPLVDVHGLTHAEAGEAAAQAIDAIVADLERAANTDRGSATATDESARSTSSNHP